MATYLPLLSSSIFSNTTYHLPLRTDVPRTAPFGPIAAPDTLVADLPLGPVTVVLAPAAAPFGPTATPACLVTVAEPLL